MFRLASVVAVVALLVPFHAIAQTSAPAPPQSAPAPPPPAPLPPQGVISVYVTGVGVKTRSSIGAYTAFLVRPVDSSNTRELFYVRNDDVSMAMERGAIVGLLMGAAQANLWVTEGPRRAVKIEYVTIDGRKEIVAAALGGVALSPTN